MRSETDTDTRTQTGIDTLTNKHLCLHSYKQAFNRHISPVGSQMSELKFSTVVGKKKEKKSI